MSTRSSSSNLAPPFSDPESVIQNRRRNLGDPSLLLDFEEINMANNTNNVQGPPPAGPNFPAPDLRSMEELLQAPTDGVGDAIVVPPILANQFELKIGLLNLVTAIAFHAGGNILTKNTQEALTIIENKSKVQTSRNKPQVSSASGSSTQDAAITALTKQALQERPQGVLPSNTVPNPCQDLKVITTRSGITLVGPSVPPPPLSSSKSPNSGSPARLNKEKLQDKSDIQIHSFLQIFKKLYFNISFASLAHMPKYAKMVKDLFINKEKLLELANTPLNENCSVKLSLLELTPTRITLELATRTITYPAGIAEDVFIQVGKFIFPNDFVVVDYDVDPCVPLILGRPFLRTTHSLVDVHGEELTLRVGDEKLVFNVESTSKYPRNYGDESIHKIDILDIACADHFYEVLNVQKLINLMSGSLTPSSDPVVASLSPSLTPFGDSDFILEEIDTFLASNDSISPDIDDRIFDPEGDIRLIKEFLNNEIPNDLPHPLPVFEINETEKIKTSIYNPLDLELKDLPPHLEPIYYASNTLSDAQTNYTVTKKEILAVVYAFEKFRSYLVLSKTIVYTYHSALKYLFAKQDAKLRLLRWILLLQEFNIEIRDKKKRAENLTTDHLSRLENPHQGNLVGLEMNDNFPHESLNMISLNLDNEPSLFADIAKYLVGNVLVKGISSYKFNIVCTYLMN
ncbi:reverse transcriptase domain-containing protein [Tanacetum coccineum]